MKKNIIQLLVVAFLAASTFAQAPIRQPHRERLSVASRNFDVANYGAVGDAQVATDCTATSGSPMLTCASGHFTAADVGKVITVYDAGGLMNDWRLSLATTIVVVTSASQITFAQSAQNTVNSERVVWGTNSTAAIQAAVDAAADAGGGLVTVSAGHYLATKLILDCSTIGSFPGYGWNPNLDSNSNICTVFTASLTAKQLTSEIQ